jgi:hypothetical protein
MRGGNGKCGIVRFFAGVPGPVSFLLLPALQWGTCSLQREQAPNWFSSLPQHTSFLPTTGINDYAESTFWWGAACSLLREESWDCFKSPQQQVLHWFSSPQKHPIPSSQCRLLRSGFPMRFLPGSKHHINSAVFISTSFILLASTQSQLSHEVPAPFSREQATTKFRGLNQHQFPSYQRWPLRVNFPMRYPLP